MSETVLVAIIAASATIIAALIGTIGKKIGAKKSVTRIKQVSKGGDSIQIGVQKKQYNYLEDENHGKHVKR